MADMVRQRSPIRLDRAAAAWRRRWLRWVVAGLVAGVVLVFAGAYVFVHFLAGPVPVPLALPELTAAAAGQGSAPVSGTWTAGKGSLAGYRVREDFLGPGNTMAGRTSAVTGTAVIAYNEVSSASFRVGLTAVTVNGKAQPQLAKILDTASFPDAAVTLAKPAAAGRGRLRAGHEQDVQGAGSRPARHARHNPPGHLRSHCPLQRIAAGSSRIDSCALPGLEHPHPPVPAGPRPAGIPARPPALTPGFSDPLC